MVGLDESSSGLLARVTERMNMKHTHTITKGRGLVAVALAGGALTVALVGGPTAASAGSDAGASGPATITMQLEGGKFFFEGSKQVTAGRALRIRNNTNPRKGGPHTFSLVERNLIPDTPGEQKKCFGGGICGPIAVAHEFNEKSGKVGRPLVKVGRAGWNRSFAKRSRGDTWYSETDGETFSQKVSASAGRTLHYMCAIHPEMQGKIKVVGNR
ncbi:MAG: hypothetical protein WKF49_08180 [Thermoleophilaceae bacterium]